MSEEKIWHVLTITEGGSVSLLQNLDENTARQTVQALTPYDQRPDWDPPGGSWITYSDAGRIKSVLALGPEGKTLNVWQEKKAAIVTS